MELLITVIVGIVGTIAGATTAIILSKQKINQAKLDKTNLLKELENTKSNNDLSVKENVIAQERAKQMLFETEQKALEYERNARERVLSSDIKVAEIESRIIEKDNNLSKRILSIEDKEYKLETKLAELEENKSQIQAIKLDLSTKLEQLSGLTKDEAKTLLLQEVDASLLQEKGLRIKREMEKIQREIEDEARNLLVQAMDQAHTDYIAETTTKSLEIESDEIKGRIIGRDGRNIKAFEKATGCEVIVDEAPNVITISGFDPLRREVAFNALNALIKDGRIHPGRIEEFVQKSKLDLAKEIRKAGDDISATAGVNDLPIEIIRVLGRFKYRYSYGQNQARHILEVSKIAGYIAEMIGLGPKEVRLARKAGLLHDLGKVASESENPNAMGHPEAGVLIGKKYGIEEEVLNVMMSHHYLAPEKSLYDWIVRTSDAISGGRPGARNASIENYTRRVQALEEIAMKYSGVKEAYAIYAGREVRVFVDPGEATDESAVILARDIAKEIEETQTYPGTVQITVIREQRITDTAKATTVKDLKLPQMSRNSD